MSAHGHTPIPAAKALKMLSDGNRRYINATRCCGDVSEELRQRTAKDGQHPFAVVITCSDSRVIPECIFRVGIGDLFVIRVAGNVIDKHQLGSVEYALSHLGCKLVVVLGHNHCGAVGAALHDEPDGHIKFITDEIRKAIGAVKDEDEACRLNVLHSVAAIEKKLDIKKLIKTEGLAVIGAIYELESGRVEFIGDVI